MLDAMRLKCSADRLGAELPFHIIYGGGLTEPRLSQGFPTKFGVIRIALGLVLHDFNTLKPCKESELTLLMSSLTACQKFEFAVHCLAFLGSTLAYEVLSCCL